MYLEFYRLTTEPFRLIPDERFFYFSARRPYREAMARLAYGLGRGEGFVVVTGEVGSGKTTTLSRLRAMASHGPGLSACVTATPGSVTDLLRRIALGFNIPATETEQTALPKVIENFLIRCRQGGKVATLVVDEAHHLTPAALDELRMICDVEQGGRALLQIILVGQPAFRDVLRQDGLEQFRQRVVASFHVSPMLPDETRRYIVHRLTCAGWRNDPDFSEGAFAVIHHWSSGLPRKVNLLAAHVLLHGSLHQKHQLDAPDVESVCRDLDAEPGRDGAAGVDDDADTIAIAGAGADADDPQPPTDGARDEPLLPCNENDADAGEGGEASANPSTCISFPLLAQPAPIVTCETPAVHDWGTNVDAAVTPFETNPVSAQTADDARRGGTTVVAFRPPLSNAALPPSIVPAPPPDMAVEKTPPLNAGAADGPVHRRRLPVVRIAVVAAAFSVLVVGRSYEGTHTDEVFEQLAELRASLLVSRAAVPATLVPPVTDEAAGAPSAPAIASAVSGPALPMAARPAGRQAVPPPISMPLSAPAPVPAFEPASEPFSGPDIVDQRAPAAQSDDPGADDPGADDEANAIEVDDRPEAPSFRAPRAIEGDVQTMAEAPSQPDAPAMTVAAPPAPPSIPSEPAAGTAVVASLSQAGAAARSRVVLVATAPCWTEVRNADGRPTFRALMTPGERYRVPTEKGMTMRVGNAGAMTVLLDGRRLPPVGGDGRIIGNIPLDPDRLMAYVTSEAG